MPNFTKKAIIASFLKLLDERPLSKITVKDIVEDCGINRNSFYYHFEDLPSLITEIVTEEINRIIEQYPSVDSFEQCLEIAAQFALAHKKAALHIFNSASRDVFEHYLWKICDYIVRTYLNPAFAGRNIDDTDKNALIQFYTCEVFGQMVGWLESGMAVDLMENNRRLCELRKGMMDEVLDRCEIKQ